MDFYQELADFRKKIDLQIVRHFDEIIADIKKQDVFSTELICYAKKMTLAGGKRLRPALLYWGYIAAGGKDHKKIMQAAVAMEFIHMFLLIHDDIMDKGMARHGIDSLNFHFKKVSQKVFKKSNAKDFGDSCAIIAGDMLYSMGNSMIAKAGFTEKDTFRALQELQRIIFTTTIGQMQDVYMEYSENVCQKQILKMYKNKTAQYTFQGPLILGAMLAGNDSEEFFKGIGDYAIPLGIAFQIQDDILGIFGNEKKTGKSVVSDIEDGKETILVAKARENSSKIQKKEMLAILGKSNIRKSEIKNFQKIIVETGSLQYARKIIAFNIAKSKESLKKIVMAKKAQKFLYDMADFMEKREM